MALLLAGVATGATVVVAAAPGELAGAEVAFVQAQSAEAALAAGADEVLALSGSPLGARLPVVPSGVVDYAAEVPSYGDAWTGPVPSRLDVEAGGAVLPPLPELGLGLADRVLTAVRPADPHGLAALLAALRSGAALVLVPDPAEVDLARVVAQEGVTATLGVEVTGVPGLPSRG